MTWETLALFAITEFLLSLSPGPAVLLVMGLSLRQGFRAGFGATAGILVVNALYFALSALGVGALILASATLFMLLKWVGAAYLVWLGFQMLRPTIKSLIMGRLHGENGVAQHIPSPESAGAEAGRTKMPSSGHRRHFWQGVMLQAANPKNLAFFVAILPQFVSPTGDVAWQLLLLGMVSVTIELPILLFYSLAFSWSARFLQRSLILVMEALGGGVLVCLGAAMAFYRRAEP